MSVSNRFLRFCIYDLTLFCFLCLRATSQTDEGILFSIMYSFVHVDDTTKPNIPFRSTMLLDISKSFSRYGTFAEGGRFQNERNNQGAITPAAQSVVGQPLAVVPLNPMGNEYLFRVIPKKQLIRLSSIFSQDYIVEQPLPAINWKIHKEQRKIGEYTCQKATAYFAGRNYTAWFTAALPFSFGPWKLGGLPGLILEATDDRNQVQFLFQGFQKPLGSINGEEIGERPVKTTEAKLQKAKAQYEKDPLKTAEAMLRSGDDAKVAVMYQGFNGELISAKDAQKTLDEMRKKTINNPLELTRQ